MSRQYNAQGIHSAELNLNKATKQLKRWGGKGEMDKYIRARNDLDRQHEIARQNKDLSDTWNRGW